jgi:hypothetical protein
MESNAPYHYLLVFTDGDKSEIQNVNSNIKGQGFNQFMPPLGPLKFSLAVCAERIEPEEIFTAILDAAWRYPAQVQLFVQYEDGPFYNYSYEDLIHWRLGLDGGISSDEDTYISGGFYTTAP